MCLLISLSFPSRCSPVFADGRVKINNVENILVCARGEIKDNAILINLALDLRTLVLA